jgi:hypothetical protein
VKGQSFNQHDKTRQVNNYGAQYNPALQLAQLDFRRHPFPISTASLKYLPPVWFADPFSPQLQFWEKTIPESDRSSLTSLISFISNRVG